MDIEITNSPNSFNQFEMPFRTYEYSSLVHIAQVETILDQPKRLTITLTYWPTVTFHYVDSNGPRWQKEDIELDVDEMLWDEKEQAIVLVNKRHQTKIWVSKEADVVMYAHHLAADLETTRVGGWVLHYYTDFDYTGVPRGGGTWKWHELPTKQQIKAKIKEADAETDIEIKKRKEMYAKYSKKGYKDYERYQMGTVVAHGHYSFIIKEVDMMPHGMHCFMTLEGNPFCEQMLTDDGLLSLEFAATEMVEVRSYYPDIDYQQFVGKTYGEFRRALRSFR